MSICTWRFIKTSNSPAIDPNFYALAATFTEVNNFDFSSIFLSTEENNQITVKENLFFNYCIRLILSDFDSNQQRVKIGRKMLNLNIPLIQFCLDLLNEFRKQFHLPNQTEENYVVLLYFLVLTHMFIFFFDVNMYEIQQQKSASEFPHYSKQKQIEWRLKKIYTDIISNNQLYKDFPFSQSDIDFLLPTLYMAADYYHTATVNIMVQYSKRAITESYIKQKIKAIFGVEAISFVTDPEKADIILSDSHEEDVNDERCFIIEDPMDITLWATFLASLQQKIIENIFI